MLIGVTLRFPLSFLLSLQADTKISSRTYSSHSHGLLCTHDIRGATYCGYAYFKLTSRAMTQPIRGHRCSVKYGGWMPVGDARLKSMQGWRRSQIRQCFVQLEEAPLKMIVASKQRARLGIHLTPWGPSFRCGVLFYSAVAEPQRTRGCM